MCIYLCAVEPVFTVALVRVAEGLFAQKHLRIYA